MAFKLNMGNKPTDPNNFSQRDQKTMNASRATFDNQSSFSHPDFTQEKSVKKYKSKGFGGIKTAFGTLGDTRVTGKPKSEVLK